MTPPRRTGRILLTLDPDTLRDDLIDTAVRLARAYEAELVTLFVKASDLINMASLPFETTVIGPGGRLRTIDTGSLDRRLNQLAQQAEQIVARRAGNLPWSFRVATGHVEQIISEQAGEFDLLTVCCRTTSRIRASAASLPTALLLLGDGLRHNRPVVAVFDGDTDNLATAQRIAQAFELPLKIVVGASDEAEKTRLRSDLRGWLSENGVSAELLEAAPEALAHKVHDLRPGLVIISRGSPLGAPLHDALDTGAGRAPLLELPSGK